MNEYFYDWGGMKLEPSDWQIDNGSLFAGTYYALKARQNKLTEEDKARWVWMMSQIEVRPGVYARYPGSKLMEAHDNYLGIILGALVFDLPGWITQINDVPYYNYNDQSDRWHPYAQRQGGEIALYKLADHEDCNRFLTLWLSFGLALGNVFNLAWCRCEILRIIWPRVPERQKKILRAGISVWFEKMGHAYLDGTIITHYYQDKNHPNCQLAQDLWDGKWWLK